MRALTPSQASYAARVQAALGLGDWTIRYVISDDASDSSGRVFMRQEYHDAAVTIYARSLDEAQADGFPETVERVLLHELAEVKVAESIYGHIPEWLFDAPPIVAARDILADVLARVCERLGVVA